MPYSRPTLSELRADTAADVQAELESTDALLRYSNLAITAKGQANLAHGHYGYLDWIARQAVPFTAEEEFLEGWAGLKDVTRKPATKAAGTATFTGTNGTPLPIGTPLSRNDGVKYVTTNAATVAGGTVTVSVSAVDAGSGGNAQAGISLTLGIGVAGIAATGISSLLIGGAEIETDDDLRGRMLKAYAQPSQGGSTSDYEEWALAVPGVTRCWVRRGGMGPGTLILYFMMDNAQAAHGGFPQGTTGVATGEDRDAPATGDQLTLANAIFEVQSAYGVVYAAAPIPNTLNFTIAGLSGASAGLKAAIAGAISGALLRTGTPGGVTPILPIEGAMSAVAGSAGAVITNITASAGTITPGTAGNITSNAGALPVLGTITWS
jgi:uncharacterized phage protein gp47/JayE